MRHLTGFILGLATAAGLFFGGGWGVARIVALQSAGTSLTSTRGLLAVAALVGAGLLAGLMLAVPGISPLAAGLPGLVLLAWSGLLMLSARHAFQLIPVPGHYFAEGFRTMLSDGVLALLGAVLVMPLFVPSRWRSRPSADEEFAMPAVMERLSGSS